MPCSSEGRRRLEREMWEEKVDELRVWKSLGKKWTDRVQRDSGYMWRKIGFSGEVKSHGRAPDELSPTSAVEQ